MANNDPSFAQSLFGSSFGGTSLTGLSKQRVEEVKNVANMLGNEFSKIERASNLYTDSFINTRLTPLQEIRTGEDLVKNIDIIDKNVVAVDNKVRSMDRSIRAHTFLLEHNRKLMEKTNNLIDKWIKEGNYTKFSDIENKMESRMGGSINLSDLDSIIDERISRRVQGEMNGGGGGILQALLGQNAGKIAGAVAAGGGVGAVATGALNGLGTAATVGAAGLMTLLKKSMPVAAASALAYVLVTPEGQNKAIEFARYLDERRNQLEIEKKVSSGQASFDRRMQEEYRRRFQELHSVPNSTVTQSDLPMLPGTSVLSPLPQTSRSVPLTVFGGYGNRGNAGFPSYTDNLDGPGDLVPNPVTVKPGDRYIPSVEEYNGETQVPTSVTPRPGDTVIPSIEDLGSLNNSRPYRVNVASLGNGLESLSSEQLGNLFGGSVTSSPRFGTKSYEQAIIEEKASAQQDGLKNYIEDYNIYSLKSKLFDINVEKALLQVAENLDIDGNVITIKAKQMLVLSAPQIRIAGKVTETKEPIAAGYSVSPSSLGVGNFSPNFGSIIPGSSAFSAPSGGNISSPGTPSIGNVPGKDNSRLSASQADGTAYAPSDNSNAAKAFRYFKSKGYSDMHAAAIVGNLKAESGPNLDITSNGDNGNAFGIAQWNIKGSPDRFANFKRLYGIDLQNSTIEQQLEFIDWELHNSEKRAGDAFFATGDVNSAAAIFDQKFERSDGTHRQRRIANANEVLGGAAGMTAGGFDQSQLPPGVISGPTPTSATGMDAIPDSHLDTVVKTSQGSKTLRELGITKYSELNALGGQAFAGGTNDPATTFALGEIANGLGPNFNRITAQNDEYHQGTGSGHTQGNKGDFTVSGMSYPAATQRTREILEEMGLVYGEDFSLIDEATNPSARASGDHIDFKLTSSGQAKVNTIREQNIVPDGPPTPVAAKGNRDGSTSPQMNPRVDTGQRPTNPTNGMGSELERASVPSIVPIQPRKGPEVAPPPAAQSNHTNTHDKRMLSAKNLVDYASTRIA